MGKTIGSGSILEQATVTTSAGNLVSQKEYPGVWTAPHDDGNVPNPSNDDITDPLFKKRSVQFNLSGTSNSFLLGTGGGAGFSGWFTFSSSAITPTKQTAPVKTVQPTTETGPGAFEQRYFNDLDVLEPWEMPELSREEGHDPENTHETLAPGVLPKDERFVELDKDYSYFINQPTINLASEGLVQPDSYVLTDTLPAGVELSKNGKQFTLYNVDGTELPLDAGQVVVGVNGEGQTTLSLRLNDDQTEAINVLSREEAYYGGAFTLQVQAHAIDESIPKMVNQAESTFGYGTALTFKTPSNRVETQLKPKRNTMTLTFQKVALDDSTIGLKGAVFEVYKQGGDELVATGTSDENGMVTFDKTLEIGDYTLKEKSAPTGNELPDFKKDFKVVRQEDGTFKAVLDGGGEINEKYQVKNRLAPIKVSFHKVGENGQPLEGATFALYTDPKSGAALGTATSDANGLVSFDKELDAGHYLIEETEAPAGYAKLTDPIKFEVKRGTSGLEAVVDNDELSDYKVTNKLAPLSLTFTKVDGADQPLGGAKFAVKQGDTTITTGKSDESGRVTFDDPLEIGDYTLYETAAPEGFTLAGPIDFEVKKGDEGLVAVLKQDDKTEINLDYHLKNELKPVDLLLNKVDFWNQNQLAGAKFKLTDQSDASNVLYSQVNKDDQANLAFVGIKPGTYTLAETEAPAGYLKTEKTWTVTVTATGEVTVPGHDIRVNKGGDRILAGIVTVKNTPATILPHTGGPGTNLLLAIAVTTLGMAFMLGTLTWLKRREVRDHE